MDKINKTKHRSFRNVKYKLQKRVTKQKSTVQLSVGFFLPVLVTLRLQVGASAVENSMEVP